MKSRILGSSARTARAPKPPERLPLTSMVDMMTILIVFLLQSFSDDGSLLTPASGVALPIGANGDRPWNTVSIEVTETEIRFEGESVCTIREVEESSEASIPSLTRRLELATADAASMQGANAPRPPQGLNSAQPSIAGVANTPESGRRVLIQCDRDREFALLKKILRTCSEAGYEAPGLLIERSGS